MSSLNTSSVGKVEGDDERMFTETPGDVEGEDGGDGGGGGGLDINELWRKRGERGEMKRMGENEFWGRGKEEMQAKEGKRKRKGLFLGLSFTKPCNFDICGFCRISSTNFPRFPTDPPHFRSAGACP